MTPDEFTNQVLMLDVGDGHTIYVHDWGKKDAKHPIVTLHGGPGSGAKDSHKSRFDPTKQRVIFHSQRGCGQSTPYGELQHNTTEDLIEDIEKIVNELRLERFILTGGSWGSTLALAYTLKYPKRVQSLILQGIFTASKQETDYILNGMYRTHFPDVWDTYASSVPTEYRQNPSTYHLEKMFGSDIEQAKLATKTFGETEGSIISLDDRLTPTRIEDFDPIPTRIEAHYIQNGCFLPEDRYILKNAHKIEAPTWIVQGRYDFVCPPITAYELSRKMPNAQLIWTQAGHANDRSNYEVLRSLLLQASLSA